MSSMNFSVADALSRTSAATASFLSSLNTAFSGGLPGSGLFDNLLSQTDVTLPTPPPVNTNAIVPVSTPPVNNSAATDTPDAAPPQSSSLQDVLAAWRGFIEKWHASKNGNSNAHSDGHKSADGHKATTNASATNNSNVQSADKTPDAKGASHPTDAKPAQNAVTPATNAAPVSAAANTDAPTTPATTPAQNASPDTTTSPTISDLIAELQAILQIIQQQIKNTPVATQAGAPPQDVNAVSGDTANTTNLPNNTAAASGPADNGPTGNAKDTNLLTAADMLADLLLLTQFAEKKLNLTVAVDPQNAATADTSQPAATPTDPASLDAQLKTSLKSLLDALQANVTANGNDNVTAALADTGNAADASATVNAGMALSNLPASPSATVPNLSPSVPSPLSTAEIIKSGLAIANDFAQQLNNLFAAPAAPPSAAPAVFIEAGIASPANNGASLDSNTTDGDNTPADNIATSNANNASPLVTSDSTKSANPYSFASQLSATRASNGGNVGLPSAVEQVMLQLSRNVKNGNDQMTLQLQPADLGRIDIKLSFSADGKVQGTVVASNPGTLDLLLKDVRGLERALQDAGLSADPGSLQFSLGGQSGDTSGQMPGNSSSGATSDDDEQTTADVLSVPANPDPTETWYITPGRVNLQV